MAFEIGQVVYFRCKARPHRARASPLPQSPAPFRGTARQRPRVAPRREPRPRAVHSLAPQRAHERRRPGGLRLAAGLRPYHRGRVPHHRRVWPVAAPGVHIRAFKMLVQLLHLRFAIGPGAGPRSSVPTCTASTPSSNGESATPCRPHGSICRTSPASRSRPPPRRRYRPAACEHAPRPGCQTYQLRGSGAPYPALSQTRAALRMAAHPVAVAVHLALPVDLAAHVLADLVDDPGLELRRHQVPPHVHVGAASCSSLTPSCASLFAHTARATASMLSLQLAMTAT